MLRKLVAAIIGVSALIPGTVFGLGMGEVQLDSFLNQPLEARIELVQTRGLTSSEIIANLAGVKEFSAAGVERSFFLSQLKFEVVQGEDGKTYLNVTSKRPVTEPYLNFLVEVQWPAGRLLREYTMLLDPPEFKDELPLAIRAPETRTKPVFNTEQTQSVRDGMTGVQLQDQQPEEPKVKITTPDESSVLPRPRAEQGTAAQEQLASELSTTEAPNDLTQSEASDDAQPQQQVAEPTQQQSSAQAVPGSTIQSYKVRRGDTLSKIVKETQGSTGATAQALIAYQYLNPEAFIDNNVNLIRTGAVIRVPSQTEIEDISRSQAVQEIAAQNRAWRAKVQARQAARQTDNLAGRQLDGTGRELTPDAPADATDEGRLSLVAPESEESAAEGASGRGESGSQAGMSALEDQLALQTEEVEKFNVANEGLTGELKSINDLIEKTDRVLTLKDDQIAALQAQLAAILEEAENNAAAGGTPVDGQDVQEIPSSAQADGMQSEGQQEPEIVTDEEQALAEQAAVEEQAAQEQVKAEDEEKDFDSSIAEEAQPASSILTDPMYIGAGVALILAILGLLWVRSREDDDEDEDDDDFDSILAEAETEQAKADDGADNETFSEENLDRQMLEAKGDFDIDTVLSEADIYVAYGHFAKAIAMLEGGLKQAPNSKALNLKLMEVHAEAKEPAKFEQVEKHVRSFASDDQTLQQINKMRQELGLAAGAGPKPAAESAVTDDFNEEETQFVSDQTQVPSEDEDFLSLADIEAELDVGHQGGSTEAKAKTEKSLDVDFDEELTADSRFVAEETQVNAEELDLSSGALEFNFEETSVPENDLADTDLDSFSPDDALADIDQEIGGLNEDLRVDEQDPSELLSLDDVLEQNPQESVAAKSEGGKAFDLDDGFTLDDDLVISNSAKSGAISAEDASLLDGVDEVGTKLDLATAYMEMGDHEGAKDILDEVLLEGNDDQQQMAKTLLDRIG